MIKNYSPKNPPPGLNLGPKFPPHVGRSPKKLWKQFRPYIKMSMYYLLVNPWAKKNQWAKMSYSPHGFTNYFFVGFFYQNKQGLWLVQKLGINWRFHNWHEVNRAHRKQNTSYHQMIFDLNFQHRNSIKSHGRV